MKRTMRRPATGTLALLAAVVLIATLRGDDLQPRTVKVTMPDGVALETDVYLPPVAGRFPTVLVRTPYGRRQLADPLFRRLVAAGYAVVSQDVRGTNGSGGRFLPFISERTDGLATLDWIASQEWSGGNVGIWGASYLGFCGMVLAADGNPHLRTIVNVSGWNDSQALVAPGGALHLMAVLPWTMAGQIGGEAQWRHLDWTNAFLRLPVASMPAALGLQGAPWEGTAKLMAMGVLSQRASVAGALDRVRIPILHVTGWYDFVSPQVLGAYESLTAGASRSAGAAGQSLVVGPWRHDQILDRDAKVGDTDFGPAAWMGTERLVTLSLEWFNRHLKLEPLPATGRPVRLFVMGENAWHEFDRWPPESSRERTWYVSSARGASGAAGDGALRDKPGRERSDAFDYDPADPVPTVGGANAHFFPEKLGVRDQRGVETRRDVLVYSSPPLRQPLDVIGPVRAIAFASTTGRQIDITAKLVDVRPDGYAAILADGIRRGPDPVDGEAVTTLVPGKVYQFTIDLGGTACRFDRGHRVRLEISSGNFPKFVRNPATGEDAFVATQLRATRQTVYQGGKQASRLVLHVLTR